MNDSRKAAASPRTNFPPFQIGALHIPMQRIEMDRDALRLQGAILATASGVRRRWQLTNKVNAVSRVLAGLAYLGGVVAVAGWAGSKLWS